MAKVLIAIAALFVLSACTATERGAATGAAIGGLGTAAVTGSGRKAAVGALVGGVAGALIGRASEPGKCRYRDRRGRIYIDDC